MSDYDTKQVTMFFADYRVPNSMVKGWLDGFAADHLSTEEAMSRLSKRMDDYLDAQYDSILKKAVNDVQRFFLHLPSPYWPEVANYFADNYREVVFDRDSAARAGGLVSSDYYEEMLNVMPPRDVPRDLLDRYGCMEGFLMGEPYGSDSKGRRTYKAYGRSSDGRCLYLGLSPAAGGPAASDQRKPSKASPSRKPARKASTAKVIRVRSGNATSHKGARR